MSAAAKGTGGGRGRSRRGGGAPARRYPRAARINEVLRQVLADEIERLVDTDDRLTLLTVTAVQTDQDLRRATLLFSRLGPAEVEALDAARVRLQATIARQVRMKWTPLLTWAEDPAIVGGQRVEDILRGLRDAEVAGLGSEPAVGSAQAAGSEVAAGPDAAVGDDGAGREGGDDAAHGVA